LVGKARPPPPPARPVSPPPEHLKAPTDASRLALHARSIRASGSLWEGLDPWGSSCDGQFPSWCVNFDRLRDLWAPPEQVPVEAAQAQAARDAEDQVMDRRVKQNVEIVVKSLKLQPDRIKEALLGNFEALSPQQIRALAWEIVPVLQVAGGLLQALVHRRGAASLGAPEAVLWAVASTPLGDSRAHTLALRVSVPEEIAMMKAKVQPAVEIVSRLSNSAPLRMLLQAILVVRSVLSQQKCSGFPIRELGSSIKHERYRRAIPGAGASRYSEWYQEHVPTTLRLVSEIVADSHVSYTKLRFFTLVAVCKACPKIERIKRLIWSYLGTPVAGGSIIDACKLLQECDSRIFDKDLLHWIQTKGLYRERAFNSHVRPLQRHLNSQPLSEEVPFREHLSVVSAQLNEAQETFRTGWTDLMQAAQDMCCLAGETPPSAANREEKTLEMAAEGLQHLKVLGRFVREEVEFIWFVQRRRRLQAMPQKIRTDAALGNSGFSARSWKPVDTRCEVLAVTGDPDLIREMRMQLLPPEVEAETEAGEDAEQARAKAKAKAAAAKAAAAKAQPKAKGAPARYVDLIHSGIEGVYSRDPVTGRWGRRADGVDGQSRDVTVRGRTSTA